MLDYVPWVTTCAVCGNGWLLGYRVRLITIGHPDYQDDRPVLDTWAFTRRGAARLVNRATERLDQRINEIRYAEHV